MYDARDCAKGSADDEIDPDAHIVSGCLSGARDRVQSVHENESYAGGDEEVNELLDLVSAGYLESAVGYKERKGWNIQ